MNRRGNVTVYLILAFLLVGVMFGAIWVLREARRSAPAPLLLKLKADYQMESAILMVLQKVRLHGFEAASDTLDLRSREIAPGILLSLICNRIASDVARFDVRVEGGGLGRHLMAQATCEILPAAGPASSVPEVVTAGTPQWRLEYLPEGETGFGR